jgi:hypothetical protein
MIHIGVQNESSCCNPNNDGMNWQVVIQLKPDSFSQQHTPRLRFPAGILMNPMIPFFQAFGEEL